MKIYTRAGDDGTTGLYFGGRVEKDAGPIELNGTVDEAQAHLGWARSLGERGSACDELLIRLERDLWVLMAEVATLPQNRHKLVDESSRVTSAMVTRLEGDIDRLSSEIVMPREFVVPGDHPQAAALDVARTVVRRAERLAVRHAVPDSYVVAYLNRLSDLVWTLARWVEGPDHRAARQRD